MARKSTIYAANLPVPARVHRERTMRAACPPERPEVRRLTAASNRIDIASPTGNKITLS
jgi:hypothetical protein